MMRQGLYIGVEKYTLYLGLFLEMNNQDIFLINRAQNDTTKLD